jgi:HlyD family secretion protein
MKKKIIVPAVLVTVAVISVAWWLQFGRTESSNSKVFISGNIEATEVDLSFRIGGQITRLPIEEGDRVEAGKMVAELDRRTLLAQKGAAEAEIANARAVLDELEAGTRTEVIEAARAATKAAESRMINARAEYERYLPLLKEGAVSRSIFDAREMTYRVATEDYNNAKERLIELEAGPREEQIRAARARLERANWELKRIELDLQYSILESPVNAVVLVKANELGEVVLPGATVATVAAIDEVWLKGYIGERFLGKVKLGQVAEVTTDSYPGKKYSGRVTFISSRAEFTPKNVQTQEERVKQVYRVKVTIPNPSQELKIGMPAEGYILTDSVPVQQREGEACGKPSS